MVIKDVIKDVEAFFVKVPTKVKYKMSKGGSRRSYMGAIIRITTDTGLTGYGEVFGTPGWYSAEAPDGMLRMINRWFRPILVKERICDIERIIYKLDEERMGNNFAKSGVDMALYDLMGKSLGVPVCDLIGGRFHNEFEMVGGMGIFEPEEMAEKAVVDQLAPICVQQFLKDPNREERLKELKEKSSWEQGDYVKKTGWATMPGAESPAPGVADECATRLMELKE